MAASYALGVFNDNLFKEALMLIAVSIGMSVYQGYAAILFTVPFILFAAPAGWMADKYPKHSIIIMAKVAELIAMIIGAIGVYYLNWPLVFVMLFIMALQSAVFSPALNGSIPELYPENFVPVANARVKVIVNTCILGGMILAGFTLAIGNVADPTKTDGRTYIAIAIVAIGVLGVLTSFGAPKFPARNPTLPFPKKGPIASVKTLIAYKRDPLLLTSIIANAFIFFVAVILTLLMNDLGQNQLRIGTTGASLLKAALLVGVAIGGLISPHLSKGKQWHRVIVPGIGGMALGIYLLWFLPMLPNQLQIYTAYFLIAFIGALGGLALIPLESFIQNRPDLKEKGTVWATANFAAFSAMMVSGGLYNLGIGIHLIPTDICLLLAIITATAAFLLWGVLPNFGDNCNNGFNGIAARFVQKLIHLRYKVSIEGIEKITDKGSTGILFLPNHPGLIDPPLMISHLYPDFSIRPLADQEQIERPVIKQLSSRIGTLPIPDVGKLGADQAYKIDEALDKIAEGLNKGGNFLLYPAGMILRSREEEIGGKSAVETILKKAPNTRIVLVRTKGLWGSSFTWAIGKAPSVAKALLKGLWGLIISGIFFIPKRQIDIDLVEPDDFPRDKSKDEINAYLEKHYNAESRPNTYVPYSIWERGGVQIMPEPERHSLEGDTSEVSEYTRNTVYEYLRNLSGVSYIADDARLGGDLGLDSLAIAELMTWVESEFGFQLNSPDVLKRVSDVLLAAEGLVMAAGPIELKPIPAKWFANSIQQTIKLQQGESIIEIFIKHATLNRSSVVLGDQNGGVRTYSDLMTSCLVLKPFVSEIEGDYVGVMLPAGIASTTAYLSVLASGKIPVMLNWTVGLRNLKHSIRLLGINKIITSSILISRLKGMGNDLSSLDDKFFPLENLRTDVSIINKLAAFLKARFMPSALLPITVPETAVVLFTSGSESLPKAVPLTNTNILTNIRDILTCVDLNLSDKFLGMLPPFHSFGLTATTVLPLLTGIKVVYHSNPTEAAMLSRLIEEYRASVIIGTPTFLNGILRISSDKALDSLRIAVTGAEKCPESVYNAFTTQCPNAVMIEGYGITECSPAVSLTDDKSPQLGTIGKVLPSVEYAIVNAETNTRVKPGERGMLLVSGPSIFNGYIGHDGPSPFVEFENKKWYRTGDLVSEDTNNVLTFRGRLKRFVKLGGEMISLPAIESALENEFASELENDGPVIAVEATPHESKPELVLFTVIDIVREEANKAIGSQGLSPLHNIRRVIKLEELPLLGTGKTDYRSLKTMLENE